MMKKAMAVKGAVGTAKGLKESITKLTSDITNLKNDAKALSTITGRLKKEIDSGNIIKLG